METRCSAVFVLLASFIFFHIQSCSGGGVGANPPGPGCKAGVGLCVTSCNLGCSNTGCTLTRIAVNQPIRLSFNQQILPESVDQETFKLRTAAGKPPVGSFLVQNNIVLFFPEIVTIDRNNFFFGFTSGETYTLTIPSKDQALKTILSEGGDPIAETFTCTLRVTEGIKDFDDRPPFATLLVPNRTDNVSVDSTIVLEFSEIINTSTLFDPTPGRGKRMTGVTFTISQFNKQSKLCATSRVPLPGTATLFTNKLDQRTVLRFAPSAPLPGEICVRVTVLEQVRDLSNKSAKKTIFQFRTEVSPAKTREIVEDFQDPLLSRDLSRDGSTWSQDGAVAKELGGNGRLGDFDINFGAVDSGKKDAQGRSIYLWDVRKTVIPGTRTLTGESITVTDAVYEFTSFVLAADKHLRFVGPPVNGVVLKVSGEMQIRGALSVSAPQAQLHKRLSGKVPPLGQSGQPGVPGASPGGKGGDVPEKKANSKRDPNGKDGGGLRFPPGHPLARQNVQGAGGASRANPKDAFSSITYSWAEIICQQLSSGGGGGGYFDPSRKGIGGGRGIVIRNKFKAVSNIEPFKEDFGPRSLGGTVIDIEGMLQGSLQLPSAVLFHIGGAGGGGAGASPIGSISTNEDWSSSMGGGGGGGILQLKAGGGIVLARSGAIFSRGADGQAALFTTDGEPFGPSPGGGGSGGSILLQSSGILDLRGIVSVRGGKAGSMLGWDPKQPSKSFLGVDSLSGAGTVGFIRVEADPKPDFKSFDRFEPAPMPINAGLLRSTDHDDVSIIATTWYDTKIIALPRYLDYRLVAMVDGKEVIFTDAAGKNRRLAQRGEPVVILFQGAQLDPQTQSPDPKTISRWVEGSMDALNLVGGNLFRVLILLDAGETNKTQALRIKKASFRFQG